MNMEKITTERSYRKVCGRDITGNLRWKLMLEINEAKYARDGIM